MPNLAGVDKVTYTVLRVLPSDLRVLRTSMSRLALAVSRKGSSGITFYGLEFRVYRIGRPVCPDTRRLEKP